MPNVNLSKVMEEMEQAQTEIVSDFFKFPVGQTRIRILTVAVPAFSLYKGVYPNAKYVKMLPHFQKAEEGSTVKSSAWSWAIIRGKSGKCTNENLKDELKIVQFPFSMIKLFDAMFADPDWGFDKFPMPYDITVGNTGEGGSRYSIIGSPKHSEVPAEVMAELGKKKSCESIIKAILEKQGDSPDELKTAFQGKEYPVNENDPDGTGPNFEV